MTATKTSNVLKRAKQNIIKRNLNILGLCWKWRHNVGFNFSSSPKHGSRRCTLRLYTQIIHNILQETPDIDCIIRLACWYAILYNTFCFTLYRFLIPPSGFRIESIRSNSMKRFMQMPLVFSKNKLWVN